ncbi:MAG: 50S ribosomal protein L14 [bacterium]|nr:50S ribosomal protein L14 [bacterium]
MIQERTILKVADNSGAKKVRCFRMLGGSKRKYARIGDIIIAAVQVAEPRKQVKKKDKVRALVVRTQKEIKRKDGSYIRFDENAVVLLEDANPKGTRVFGPIPREIKELGFDAIASLAQDLV